MVADSSDNNPKSNGGAEKKERTAGQFFHIGEQGEQGDASAKVRAELHPLDYWVLDTGAAWTMTPRKELLDDDELHSRERMEAGGVQMCIDVGSAREQGCVQIHVAAAGIGVA
ncbi:unnamed protein product, partial [Closterium sp. NIES-53]